MSAPVRASAIAAFLDGELVGRDLDVTRPSSLDGIGDGALVFAKGAAPARAAALNATPAALALVTAELSAALEHSRVVVANPRLAFARAVERFFTPARPVGIAAGALVDPSAQLGRDVAIGHGAVIGAGVSIGDRTWIREHVVLSPGTRIGRDSLVKSHAVIGEEGFGFELDDEGVPIRIPHLGGVVIGDEVEIGAGTIIARGTLDDTCIGDRVKIDDAVFIAHNVIIGADSLVIAHAEVSGSVRIGEKCWIGPSASVLNGIRIGDGAMLGIGAVATKEVPAGMIVVGNPARVLRPRFP